MNTQAKDFDSTIADALKGERLRALQITSLQVNMGGLCNMSCKHCHLQAGPDRQDVMGPQTIEEVLMALQSNASMTRLDITGGAPEMNPGLRHLISSARAMNKDVTVRTNLTVLNEQEHARMPGFYAGHGVTLVASLPYYDIDGVERVRGTGAYSKSIKALRMLNLMGYGSDDGALRLNLVYNPRGAFLAPGQAELESQFKEELQRRQGVSFNSLYTINNMPIGRFRDFLSRTAQIEPYMQRLRSSFNPCTLEGLMCRSQISVGWDGRLWDCDFNLALDLPLAEGHHGHISRFSLETLSTRPIRTGEHCWACTAGQGST